MIAFDSSTAGDAFARPGMDTRQWCSYATVDPDSSQQHNVTFTSQYGPLVNVTLRPSGLPVVCRVAHKVAGNGEGEWFPPMPGDEVMVLIPEGDEKAGCVIIGHLNQEIDAWPQQVAGMDATQNNFAFKRLRTPYVLETASNYLVRDATTGAFFSLNNGAFTAGNMDKAFFTLGADLLGFQDGAGDVLVQIDVSAKQVVVEAAGTKMIFDGSDSSFYTTGILEFGASGNQAAEHATSIEAVVSLLLNTLVQIGTIQPGMLIGSALAASAVAILNAALPVAATFPYAPFTGAIAAGLSQKKTAGVTAGLGAPGILIG